MAVPARWLAGGPGVSLRRLQRRGALCAAENRLLQLRHGVADDDEVDRVADLDLISEHFVPLEPGKPVQIGELSGRSRSYELSMSNGARHSAVGMAVSHRCDLFVAVVQGSATAPELRFEALRFLQSGEMRRWTMAMLAVRF